MKILFRGECNRPPDEISTCEAYAQTLGLPFVVEAERLNHRPLAIVGGGPSINRHVDELRAWPGDIWAVNGVIRWAAERDIEATFFTVDPETYKHTAHPFFEWVKPGGKVLAKPRCPSDMFDYLIKKGADIRLFDHVGSVTGATAAINVAVSLGYSDISLFGVESSYEGTSHAYDDVEILDLMKVAVGGEEFLTKFELLIQAQYLAGFLRGLPEVYKDRSGGLLAAMVPFEDLDCYDIVAVSPTMHRNLDFDKVTA